jgi:hypothetical protein
MGQTIFQNKVNLFVMKDGRQDGKGTGLSPLSIDKHSMTGKSDATIPGRGQDYGYDVYGRIRVKNTFQEPPGGLQTATIEFDKQVDIDFLEKRRKDQQRFGVWEMSSPCGRRDNPYAWLEGGRLDYHGQMSVNGFNGGDAPARDGTATTVVASTEVTWEYDLALRPLAMASVTPELATNDLPINALFGVKEPLVPGCAPGYIGPDKHLFIGSDADTSLPADAHFSRNGGGSWTVFTNQPFGNDEHIADGAVNMLGGSNPRVIWGNGVGTAGLEIAYGDVQLGNEAATVWTVVTIDATAADYVSRVAWLWYDGLYVAGGTAGDDIWISRDQGETWTLQFTGAGDQINAIAKGFGQDCEDVYAAGASNLLLVDRGRTGTFEALTGPSGGGDFHALAIDNLGNLYAANGTSLYVSTDKGATAGGWTLLKDFTSIAATALVIDIFMPEGDSDHLYVFTDDTAPGTGYLYHSNDAGNSWRPVTAATNTGYNRGYKSDEDDNLYLVAGDLVATYGAIHRATPTSIGC